MGAIWSQQGCLKLNNEQGLIARDKLVKGQEYPFNKEGHRIYMLETPLQLLTDEWEAIASVMITEFTVGHNATKGIYKVLKVFSDEEARVVSGTITPYFKFR